MVRQIFHLDRCAHRYFIEYVSSHLHLKVMLASRYVSFHKALVNSNKLSVRFLSRLNERDNRTVLGKTLQRIMDECDLPNQQLALLSSSLVKRKMKYFMVPNNELWRLPVLKELLEVRRNHLHIRHFEPMEVESMITNLCTT